MKNFKQYINESNIDIDKIKEECKDVNPNIDYSKDNWEEKFIKKNDWRDISSNKKLSENFIEYFKDNVYWFFISKFQDLSELFIEKYKNDVNWRYISAFQDLSESFIEKHENDVNWINISLYQDLSELFIEKYKDKINFEYLFDNKHISNELILDNIYWFINEDISEKSWRLENKEFKDKWNKYKKLFCN